MARQTTRTFEVVRTLRSLLRGATWPADDGGELPGVGYTSEATQEGAFEDVTLNLVEPESTSEWQGGPVGRDEDIHVEVVVRSHRPLATEDLAVDRLEALVTVVQCTVRPLATGQPVILCNDQRGAAWGGTTWQVWALPNGAGYVGAARLRLDVQARL